MKPLKEETNAVLETASRLGASTLPRYHKELKYLSAALVALLGEYGEDVEATASKPGRALDTFTLKHSRVGFLFRPDTKTDCVMAIDLLLGKARAKRERDVTYTKTKVGQDFNVPRIAGRALELHRRFLLEKSQEAAVEGNMHLARSTVSSLVSQIFGVETPWEKSGKDGPPVLTAFKVNGGATGVRVWVQATADGFTTTLTTSTEKMQAKQLEKALRSLAAL